MTPSRSPERTAAGAAGPAYVPIVPLPETAPRPFWSVMIPTRDRARYLARALASVLDQAPGPDEMHIEVVDNASATDDAAATVREVAGDRVAVHRQPAPVGMGANWTTCVERARGRWVHILHDDDMVRPGFYDAYRNAIGAAPGAVMVFGRAIAIDERDEWTGIVGAPPAGCATVDSKTFARTLAGFNFVCAAACVVARRAYECLGGFAPDLAFTADWDMWTRVAAAGPVAYVHQPYALYRIHGGSGTTEVGRRRAGYEEVVETLERGARRVAPEGSREIVAAGYRAQSACAARLRSALHGEGDHAQALRHAWWSFKFRPSPGTALRLLESAVLAGRSRLPVGPRR